MRFFVTGHRGMLGHLVTAYLLQQGHEVATSGLRYTGSTDDPLIHQIVAERPDVVVNAAGVTTHREILQPDLLIANALLPQHLASVLAADQLLIHPSTDCVFRGTRGNYAVDEPPDADDAYGLSKRLGELAHASPSAPVVVLRTSIVGPELNDTRGLLAWFLAQPGPVNGWLDHHWNGITTLAWAELCLRIATGEEVLSPGVHQPTTADSVTKADLLRMFADVFAHPIEIRPVATGSPLNRTLKATRVMPPIGDQLLALRHWMDERAS